LTKQTGNKMSVLGVMSGTSLDGLDLALCTFERNGNKYSFGVEDAVTIAYSKSWKDTLTNTKDLSAEKYFRLHHNYGSYIATEINSFLNGKEKPFAIASHGHTIFHQPHLGFTTQMGCGATIAAETGITTVCDFRSLDVANGGQGAPLVPVGDKLLFGEYDSCLNIGGIANISYDKNNERVAYDICFANMALNYLAALKGKEFDENGAMAANGSIDEKLLEQLFAFSPGNKRSLAREQFEKNIIPLLNKTDIPVEDKLATVCTYAANEISQALNVNNLKNVYVTGGGAYNRYLINTLQKSFGGQVIIPADQVVQFKEALLFAFLGYLRLNHTANTLRSVTGAKSDSVGGAVYLV
jgi:anhydro-N-acetylmuramic acid kinase